MRVNLYLAESLYLAGYIERMGTGIPDMINVCLEAGLKEPELIQEESFKAILWRKVNAAPQVTPQVTPQAARQVTRQAKNLVLIMTDEMTRDELQEKLQLKDRKVPPHGKRQGVATTMEKSGKTHRS